VKIQKMGVTITEVPGVEKIEVSADHITLYGFGCYSEIHGELMPEAFGLPEARQLRDALSAAIEEAEKMADIPLFIPGQILKGDEDLPIGTVILDDGGDRWGLGEKGWGTDGSEPVFDQAGNLPNILKRWSPVTIVSLP
jgi:hypothetical protein